MLFPVHPRSRMLPNTLNSWIPWPTSCTKATRWSGELFQLLRRAPFLLFGRTEWNTIDFWMFWPRKNPQCMEASSNSSKLTQRSEKTAGKPTGRNSTLIILARLGSGVQPSGWSSGTVSRSQGHLTLRETQFCGKTREPWSQLRQCCFLRQHWASDGTVGYSQCLDQNCR